MYSMHRAVLKRKEWSRWSSSRSLKTGSSLRSQGLFLHPRSILYKQPDVGEIEGMEKELWHGEKNIYSLLSENLKEKIMQMQKTDGSSILERSNSRAVTISEHSSSLFKWKEDAFLSTVLSGHCFLSWNELCTVVLVNRAICWFIPAETLTQQAIMSPYTYSQFSAASNSCLSFSLCNPPKLFTL